MRVLVGALVVFVALALVLAWYTGGLGAALTFAVVVAGVVAFLAAIVAFARWVS